MQSSPQREFAVEVVRALKNAGFQALWAGGCVRDWLLGITPKDYDVATDATPSQVRNVFGKRRTIGVGESFGVIIVLGPKQAGQIEVATFRTDGDYSDGRRPDSVQFSSPQEDAQRRDFTINGMFFDPVEQQLHDFVGGKQDLESRTIRAIGNPRHRMEEDKLRLLRAVRFAATFDFTLDESTASAIREMAEQINVVSAERIAQELRRMLSHRNRAIAMSRCRELGLLEHIMPQLVPFTDSEWERVVTALRELDTDQFPVALAVLFSVAAELRSSRSEPAKRSELSPTSASVRDVGRALRLSNDEINHADWIIVNWHQLDGASEQVLAANTDQSIQPVPLSVLKRTLSGPFANDLLKSVLCVRRALDQPTDDMEFCLEYLETATEEMLNPLPLLGGQHLIALGMKPGPEFKRIIELVRDAQLNLEVATTEEALELVKKQLT